MQVSRTFTHTLFPPWRFGAPLRLSTCLVPTCSLPCTTSASTDSMLVQHRLFDFELTPDPDSNCRMGEDEFIAELNKVLCEQGPPTPSLPSPSLPPLPPLPASVPKSLHPSSLLGPLLGPVASAAVSGLAAVSPVKGLVEKVIPAATEAAELTGVPKGSSGCSLQLPC